jgi:hypothetical protein
MGRSVADFRAMNGAPHPHSEGNGARAPTLDEHVRGLAPALELAPLRAPSAPWVSEG